MATTVAQIRVNRMELKLADTDDPVAQQTGWDPLKPGGANFKTHELVATPTGLAVRHSVGGLVFAGVFAGFGGLALLIGSAIFWRNTDPGGLVFLGVGALFAGVGVFLLRREAPLSFDLRTGVYYRGKAYRSGAAPREVQGMLASIHALQVVQERIQSNSRNGGTSTYTSHELNLVLSDGARVNVLDHGKGEEVLDAAKRLAAALDVPVWQAGY